MLKRLFISILILSTLSSEGIINLPGNIYCFYFNVEKELGLSKCPDIDKAALENAGNHNVLLNSGIAYHNIVLTSASIQLFRSRFVEDASDIRHYDPDFSNQAYLTCFSHFCQSQSGQSILAMSDASPPCA